MINMRTSDSFGQVISACTNSCGSSDVIAGAGLNMVVTITNWLKLNDSKKCTGLSQSCPN